MRNTSTLTVNGYMALPIPLREATARWLTQWTSYTVRDVQAIHVTATPGTPPLIVLDIIERAPDAPPNLRTVALPRSTPPPLGWRGWVDDAELRARGQRR